MQEKKNHNRGQADAIAHLHGPCAVIAPPGSGKTFVLVQRIASLTQRYHVPAENILVMTFTKAAAEQMKNRYLALIGGRETNVTFGTIHAVLLRILRQSLFMGAVLPDGYARHIRIMSAKERNAILTEIVNDVRTDRENLPDIEELGAYIGKRKSETYVCETECRSMEDGARGAADAERQNPETGLSERLFYTYRRLCRQRGYLDFEDLTEYCLQMLTDGRNAEIRAFWQKRFAYLLIDEFQDVSPRQFEMIRLLALPQNHLFAVGDDDQAIYGFRGSDTGLMLRLTEVYRDLRLIRLEVNYRCGRAIVRAANSLIVHNRLRYSKNVTADRAQEGEVRVLLCKERIQQDEAIVKAIRAIPETESCAVIVRTNAQADAVQRMIAQKGLACRGKRQGTIQRHPAVRVVSAYLELAGRGRERPESARLTEDMMIAANCPPRSIARHVLAECGADFPKLLSYYTGNPLMQKTVADWQKQLETLGKLPLLSAIRYIRRGIGLDRELIGLAGGNPYLAEQYAGALDDLEERIAENADDREIFWRGDGEQENADITKRLETGGKDRGVRENIVVLTMHGAKGLEFDHVILPDVCEGTIPCKRAFLPENIEEERRLFYVAVTRAKKSLLMMCVHRQGDQKAQMSRFLKEMLQSSSSSNNSSNARSSRNSS